jgi:hypothetical protein
MGNGPRIVSTMREIEISYFWENILKKKGFAGTIFNAIGKTRPSSPMPAMMKISLFPGYISCSCNLIIKWWIS